MSDPLDSFDPSIFDSVGLGGSDVSTSSINSVLSGAAVSDAAETNQFNALFPATPSPASAAPVGSGFSSFAKLFPSIANGLAQITASIGTIVNPRPGQAGSYNAAGQWVPTIASTQPTVGTTTFGNTGNLIQSFLPLIVVGVVLWFFAMIFSSGKKR